MKHGDLIKAAVDGKTIQFKWNSEKYWTTFGGGIVAINHMSRGCESCEYRIKPEPVPDKVRYASVTYWVPYNEKEWAASTRAGGNIPVKVTIKTDENGKETKTVEIIE